MADQTGFPDVNVVSHSTQNPPPYYANQPQLTAVPTAVDTTMVPGAVGVIIARNVGPQPTRMQCGSCHAEIDTRIEYKDSSTTHIMALLLCLFGCFLCSCIPYCVDSCKTIEHYCPRCNAFIGAYKN